MFYGIPSEWRMGFMCSDVVNQIINRSSIWKMCWFGTTKVPRVSGYCILSGGLLLSWLMLGSCVFPMHSLKILSTI